MPVAAFRPFFVSNENSIAFELVCLTELKLGKRHIAMDCYKNISC